MQKKFDTNLQKILREAGLTPPSVSYAPRLLIAVSGGMDSMCLAELFLHSSLKIQFALAHCNFHLRGEESDSDAKLVASWGNKNEIHVYSNNFNTVSYASENGISIEMAARELRYSWFSQICEDEDFDAVVTAHHADDNAETLILNLVRGTGLKGLCGMTEISTNPYSENGGLPLLRPLLGFTREQIEGYVRSHGIEYNEDKTNSDSKYKRNLIRNEVLPLLKRLNPSVIKTFGREMHYFAQAEEIVEEYCRQEGLTSLSAEGPCNDRIIEIAELTKLPHWEYRLYSILERYGFNSATVAAMEDLIKSERTFAGKKFTSETYHIITTAGKLLISRKEIATAATRPRNDVETNHNDVHITGAGEYAFGDRTLTVNMTPRSEIQSLIPLQGTLYFDAEALPFPFVCRKWNDGDWIQPIGMRGRKKISDMFTDLKYSLPQKAESLLITTDSNNNHVLALLGERIDESVKIKPETRTVLILRLV